MIILVRLIAVALRLILYYSPIAKKLAKNFSFDLLPYSVANLKENYFLQKFQIMNQPILNSDNYFSVNFIYLNFTV
jgi:hypothetical protein